LISVRRLSINRDLISVRRLSINRDLIRYAVFFAFYIFSVRL
jgi:hypothetical protein